MDTKAKDAKRGKGQRPSPKEPQQPVAGYRLELDGRQRAGMMTIQGSPTRLYRYPEISPAELGLYAYVLSPGFVQAPNPLSSGEGWQRAGEVEATSKGGEPGLGRPADERVEGVPVPHDLLSAARERTGIKDAAELVAFALSLLVEPDPAAEFLREERGSLPADFRLDF